MNSTHRVDRPRSQASTLSDHVCPPSRDTTRWRTAVADTAPHQAVEEGKIKWVVKSRAATKS
jgi:hypothetical protein